MMIKTHVKKLLRMQQMMAALSFFDSFAARPPRADTRRRYRGRRHQEPAGRCRGGRFHQAQSNGGTQSKFAATFSTEEACLQAVKEHCPTANGATFSSFLGECWCDLGMTGYSGQPLLRTCWFEEQPHAHKLWSAADWQLEDSPAALVIGSAFVSAAFVGAAAAWWP